MIDLETLGLSTDCVVTQIGYVLFDDFGVHFSALIRPDIKEQVAMGRTIDPSTFIWWLEQSDEARASMCKPAEMNMYDALKEFESNIQIQTGWENIEGIWSHGMNFDLAIMESLFKRYAVKCPWAKIFRNLRDTRTLFSLIPNFKWEPAKVKHDAKADAFAQAEAVRKAWFILRENFTNMKAE